MESIKNQFARKLMEINAIKLQPNEPFTWASGWKSPIYTDNRKTLGYARLRSFVKLELCHAIQEHFPEAEAVAGGWGNRVRYSSGGRKGMREGACERRRGKVGTQQPRSSGLILREAEPSGVWSRREP